MSTFLLQSAFANFVERPSVTHKNDLLGEIERYAGTWGKEMAEGRNIGEPLAKSLKRDSYQPERLDKHIATDADGNRISVLFQRRIDHGVPWHVISWRALYPGTNTNRRFYMSSNGEPWSTPVQSALAMLEHADAAGWLKDEHIDLRRRPQCDVVVSTELSAAKRREYLDSFVVPGESFADPEFFVVCEDPNLSWRKIMIVNDGRATFRSATTNPDYGMLKHLDNGQDWNLDNSMQDCNVQQARAFLKCLRTMAGK